jgi:hypothetical protein
MLLNVKYGALITYVGLAGLSTNFDNEEKSVMHFDQFFT